MNIASDITQLVGGTPMVYLNRIAGGSSAKIALKLEFFNPMSSVKDRIATSMIEDGIKNGNITQHTMVVEPTSGNTGIGLAFVCAVKGLSLVLFMPENMSRERQLILKAFGAKLILTPASEGMPGAIKHAEEYVKNNLDCFMPQQFKNPANPQIHRETTGPEIWRDTDGKIDIFVSGVGTGGTLTGAGEYLKEKNPRIQVIAVEPAESPVLSGGTKGPHMIQGIGAGFIPEILNTSIIDKIIKVEGAEAAKVQKALSKEEGLFTGISAAAAVWAALQEAEKEENEGRLIVVIIPDNGERYLTMNWM